MSDISNYISINQSRIEATYTMVVVSAGINDLSDRLANGDVIYRRNIFLQIQSIITKIKDSLCIPVVFTTIVSKDLKKCTTKFPRKSFFHPTAITLHMQHQFEAVVDAVNGEIDEANKSHNLHCAFHLDCRLVSSGLSYSGGVPPLCEVNKGQDDETNKKMVAIAIIVNKKRFKVNNGINRSNLIETSKILKNIEKK